MKKVLLDSGGHVAADMKSVIEIDMTDIGLGGAGLHLAT